MAKLTGKASTITVQGSSLNITEITPKVTRDLADVTDSTNYDSGSDMLWPAQLAVKVGVEMGVKGWYDLTLVPAALISGLLFTGSAAVAVALTLKSGATFGHGNFDLSDFEVGVPVDNTVTYSATLKSNGVFTYGS